MSYWSELTYQGVYCVEESYGERLQEVNALLKHVESRVPYDILAC